MSEPLAEMRPAGSRRVFALAVLYALGAIALWLALTGTAGTLAALALGALAIGVLVVAEALRRATARALVLTEEGLAESPGRLIAGWDEIARVDSGTFAFKPSNGFLLRLHTPAGAAWAPGLWWRLGRRVGIGGVTDGRAARAMATEISAQLALRKPGSEDGRF
ncbi:hypothetical protein [Pseudoroseicyclus sp. CXY001]|uniref:hypothetical protein n=1 Tax=Pseudoroseicyclus sp. CXY001 TaxID=3242492 RepID=UPI003570F0A0